MNSEGVKENSPSPRTRGEGRGEGKAKVARQIASAIVLFACAFLASHVAAQSYPVKPIRIVVGYAPGGAVDFSARLLAQKLPEHLKQSVIVENRPGAGSTIGTERVAQSPPDGYTLLMMPTSAIVQSVLRTNLTYNIERDLQPISLVASGPFVLTVHPSVPARNVKELAAIARAQPGKLNGASPGVGTANHLAQELFNVMARVSITHVPYKGGAEATLATASGQVDLSFASVASALTTLQANKVRALAVTGAKRTPLLPAIPTIAESALPGYDYTVWYGMAAPANVPKDIVARLHTAIAQVVSLGDVKNTLSNQGLEPQSATPEEFAALIKRDLAQHAKLVKVANLKAE